MNEVYLKQLEQELLKLENIEDKNCQNTLYKSINNIPNIIENNQQIMEKIALLNIEINKISKELYEYLQEITYLDKIIDFDVYDYYGWIANNLIILLLLNSSLMILLNHHSKSSIELMTTMTGINTFSFFTSPLINLNNKIKQKNQKKKNKVCDIKNKLLQEKNLLVKCKNIYFKIYQSEVEILYDILDSIHDRQELEYYKQLVEISICDNYDTMYNYKGKK